ncbi:hypothetical protein ABR33_23215 [Enterobacter bugandensis]|nr:hypothetical protein ABR33_23215 [Enterobacter bugandensis]
MRFADAPAERIVAEADLRLRLVAILQLADDFSQAVFAVVAVVPAGLAVILLHGTAVYVILPANAVQLRQAVVRDLLSRAFKRVTGSIPAVQPRALRITGNYIPAMQAAKTVIFAAGRQPPCVRLEQGLIRAQAIMYKDSTPTRISKARK